jgi:hypothetical protein
MLAALVALTLAGCEKAKPRHLPFDPMATPPPQPSASAPTEGLAAGLPKAAAFAEFAIDRVGAAPDPRNRQPAITPAGQPVFIKGFAFDPTAKAPGRGVDLVVDTKVYPAAYGSARRDVARFFKAPGLLAVGFETTLPATALAVGPHQVTVRVIAVDGASYFEGRKISFQVK